MTESSTGHKSDRIVLDTSNPEIYSGIPNDPLATHLTTFQEFKTQLEQQNGKIKWPITKRQIPSIFRGFINFGASPYDNSIKLFDKIEAGGYLPFEPTLDEKNKKIVPGLNEDTFSVFVANIWEIMQNTKKGAFPDTGQSNILDKITKAKHHLGTSPLAQLITLPSEDKPSQPVSIKEPVQQIIPDLKEDTQDVLKAYTLEDLRQLKAEGLPKDLAPVFLRNIKYLAFATLGSLKYYTTDILSAEPDQVQLWIAICINKMEENPNQPINDLFSLKEAINNVKQDSS